MFFYGPVAFSSGFTIPLRRGGEQCGGGRRRKRKESIGSLAFFFSTPVRTLHSLSSSAAFSSGLGLSAGTRENKRGCFVCHVLTLMFFCTRDTIAPAVVRSASMGDFLLLAQEENSIPNMHRTAARCVSTHAKRKLDLKHPCFLFLFGAVLNSKQTKNKRHSGAHWLAIWLGC